MARSCLALVGMDSLLVDMLHKVLEDKLSVAAEEVLSEVVPG